VAREAGQGGSSWVVDDYFAPPAAGARDAAPGRAAWLAGEPASDLQKALTAVHCARRPHERGARFRLAGQRSAGSTELME